MGIYRGPTDDEQAAAKRLGAIRAKAPRVTFPEFDRTRGRVVLELDRGFAMAFDPGIYSELSRGSASDLEEVELLGTGTAISFPRIDVSLSVENLIADLLTGPRSIEE